MLNNFLKFILLTSLINVTTYGSNNLYNKSNNNLSNNSNTIVHYKIDLSSKSNNKKTCNVANDKLINIEININNNDGAQEIVPSSINYKIDLSKKSTNKKSKINNNILVKKNCNRTNVNSRKAKLQNIYNIFRNKNLKYSDFLINRTRDAKKKALKNITNSTPVINYKVNQNINKQQRDASKKALENIISYSKQNNVKIEQEQTNNNIKKKSNLGNRGKTKQSNITKKNKNSSKLHNAELLKKTGYYECLEDLVEMGIAPDISEIKLQYHNLYRELLKNHENKILLQTNDNLNKDDKQINNNNSDNNQEINNGNNTELKLPILGEDINNNKEESNINNNSFFQIPYNNNHNHSTILLNNINNISKNSLVEPFTTPSKTILNLFPYNNNLSEYWNKKRNTNIDISKINGKNLYLNFNDCDNKALNTFDTPTKIDKTILNNFKHSINNSSAIIRNRYDNLKIYQKTLEEDNNNIKNNNTHIKRNLFSEFNNVSDNNDLVKKNLAQGYKKHRKSKAKDNNIQYLINSITKLQQEMKFTPEKSNTDNVNYDSTNYQTNKKYSNNMNNNTSIKKDLYNNFLLENNNNSNKTAENIAQQNSLNNQ